MSVLAAGVRYLDLEFQGMPRVIATAVLDGPDGVALVDPGPSSCLPALTSGLKRMGIALADVRSILLTHIHLDHAGATGTLVRSHPHLQVYVHSRGARHMIDPSRLLDSARRLYAERMDTLWGEFAAVPASNIEALEGEERIRAGGRELEVAYTPGHAYHHVSFFDPASAIAFVGDTCGGRIGSSSFVMVTTPPPDVDLEAWRTSLDRILAWSPSTLFLTHFGPSEQPSGVVADLWSRLEWASDVVKRALAAHPSPAEEALALATYEKEVMLEQRRHMSAEEQRSYLTAVPLDHSFAGLARYWRKKGSRQ